MTGHTNASLAVVVLMVMVTSSRPAAASICNPASGCCEESNLKPGPLNRSYPNRKGGGVDKLVGEIAFIYHCVQYFTSFLWYKRVEGVGLVPFPWGKADDVSFFPGRHDNQTVVIREVGLDDDAVYVFVASNGTHQINGTFSLRVDCSELVPSFATHEAPRQVAELGSSKVLQCAAHYTNCPHPVDDPTVAWEWKKDGSAPGRQLKNDTLVNVNVDCGAEDEYTGQNCTVHIRKVEELLYEGEFTCILIGVGERQTVRLLPVGIEVKSWLPYVVGPAVGVMVVAAVTGLIWWRWHRLLFCCRRQPDRGKLARDAVILHGDDHEDVVTRSLLPRLRALGYDAVGEAEAARPGRPQLQEDLQAVEDSHSVILTFSTQELMAHHQIHVLHQFVFCTKARHNVVVIRFQDDDRRPPPDAGGDVEAAQPLLNDHQSVWNTTELKSFKTLTVSKALILGERDQLSLTDRRNADKFWYTLRKSLPKLADGGSRTSTSTRGNDSTADSQTRLMSGSSME